MSALAPMALPTAFQTSSVDYLAVLPFLVVIATALVGVLVEAFAPRERRHNLQVGLAVGGLLAAFVAVIVAVSHRGPDDGHQ